MYYIYHIPGVKIGCSKNPKKRIRAQGYTDYEILEQHDDPQIAGDREIELQLEYGYGRDAVHYMKSIQNSGIRKNTQDPEHQSRAGKIGGSKNGGGKRNVETGWASKLGKKWGSINGKKRANLINTCPHCNTTMKGLNYFRWHGDNCKKRNI